MPFLRSPRLSLIAASWLLLLLSACAENAPQDFLQPEGPIARRLDALWDITFGIAVVIFFLVQGGLVFLVIRFRRRSDDESPKQITHNTKLELVWTIIPVILLAALAVPTVATLFDLAEKPSGDVLEVHVLAKQWWWEYTYTDEDLVTANELHIPIDRPVYLTMEADDVIHSFWVPKLAGKQDVTPGSTTFLTIEAETPGVYLGQCAEFCGLSHSRMRLKVFAHTEADFDRWVSDQKEDRKEPVGLAAQGEEVFLSGACVGCHVVGGTEAQGRVGPDLTHFASRSTFAGAIFDNTEANLVAWLRNPPAEKPGSRMPNLELSDGDIEALVAYLQSLE